MEQTLEMYLLALGSIEGTANSFIGVCDDDVPVFLDLKESQSGSLLFLGPKGQGKTTALKSILASTALLPGNVSELITCYAFTRHPSEYKDLSELATFGGTVTPRSGSDHLIGMLYNILQSCKAGGELEQPILLAVDEITDVPEHLQEAVQELVEDGWKCGIWVIGAAEQPQSKYHFQTVFKAVQRHPRYFIFKHGSNRHLLTTLPFMGKLEGEMTT